MKLLHVLPVLWHVLILRVSQNEAESGYPDVCHMLDNYFLFQDFAGNMDYEETDEKDPACLLDNTNQLNCSWSLHTLNNDTQLSVSISVCDENESVHFHSQAAGKRVGSGSWKLPEQEIQSVILQLNFSLPDGWKTHTYAYNKNILRPLPPPANISASIIDGNLHVTWDLPFKELSSNPECYEYQLDTGNQENVALLTGKLSYTEPNADPSLNYRIRMRTRFLHNICHGPKDWSAWSNTVTVKQTSYSFDPLVIVYISLGIPMMLLASLLLMRYQRVTKVLFPPIPHPPPKYKHFLERNEQISSSTYYPVPPAKVEEEITEVEEAEQNPEKPC